VALACNGRVVAVVSMTEVKFVMESEVEILVEVKIEIKAILEDAVFAFIAPCFNTIFQLPLILGFVVCIDGEFLRRFTFQDEETHEVEVITYGKITVDGKLETVTERGTCAKVITAEGVIVGRTATQRYS
jgi:hypothetical protein